MLRVPDTPATGSHVLRKKLLLPRTRLGERNTKQSHLAAGLTGGEQLKLGTKQRRKQEPLTKFLGRRGGRGGPRRPLLSDKGCLVNSGVVIESGTRSYSSSQGSVCLLVWRFVFTHLDDH